MDNRDNEKSGNGTPPTHANGNGVKGREPSLPTLAPKTVLTGNNKLIEQIRQIISEAPEIRLEKVGPLQEALEQGTYGIDVRKLADILITKLFLDS
jgi:anti-sigma28 factor (negative regulator of flagellin synthesis)